MYALQYEMSADIVYATIALLLIVSIVFTSCKEMFEDRPQVRYMYPINPLSPGFVY